MSKAESTYQQILQVDPYQFVALHLLSVIYHQVGKNHISIDLITKAIAVKPDHTETHYNLGNTLKGLRKLDETVASYNKAFEIKSGYANVQTSLAICPWVQGKQK